MATNEQPKLTQREIAAACIAALLGTDTSADLQIPKIWFMAPAWVGMLLSLWVVLLQLWMGPEPAVGKDGHGH